MNNVYVLLSDGGQPLHLGVNSDWSSFEAEALISDNEPGLINAEKAERRQNRGGESGKTDPIHARKLSKEAQKRREQGTAESQNQKDA